MKPLYLHKFVRFTSDLDNESLAELVATAKGGDSEARDELIYSFRNFLAKHYHLLTKGKFDPSDRDLRGFVSLYVKLPRGSVKGKTIDSFARKRVSDFLQQMTSMVNMHTGEDVEQTVVLAFCHCLHRYQKREGIEFLGFIKNYYKFIIQRYVNEYLLDQNALHSFPLPDAPLAGGSSGGVDLSNEDSSDDMIKELITSGGMEELLDIDGLHGHEWDDITREERLVLLWRFIDKDKIKDIADRLDQEPRYVKRLLSEAKKKLSIHHI